MLRSALSQLASASRDSGIAIYEPAENASPDSTTAGELDFEVEIAALLTELTETQDELLSVLTSKRRAMAERSAPAMAELGGQEAALADRLRACQRRRSELLAAAGRQGMPNQSLRRLSQAMAGQQRAPMAQQCDAVAQRAKLLRHESLINWVVAQQSLLHLSQLLEILATGGRGTPTYGRDGSSHTGGSLVDKAV